MAKVKCFDNKHVKIQKRVSEHRYNKNLKKRYSDRVDERIKMFNSIQIDSNDTYFDIINFDGNKKSMDSSLDEANVIKDKLRIWVLNHRITRAAVNDLLLILISAVFFYRKMYAR